MQHQHDQKSIPKKVHIWFASRNGFIDCHLHTSLESNEVVAQFCTGVLYQALFMYQALLLNGY